MSSRKCLGQTAGSEQKVSDSAHSHVAAPGVGSSQSKGSNFYLIVLNFSTSNYILSLFRILLSTASCNMWFYNVSKLLHL